MPTLFWILLSTFSISLLAFVGIFVLLLKERIFNKILLGLIALSSGTLLGTAFLHLLPEALEEDNAEKIFTIVLLGFTSLYVFEKVLHWHHHRIGEEHHLHSLAYTNLAGEVFHNFIDGAIIAASFLVDFRLGLITSLAVALHEIPQEIGDFGILIYGGFKKSKALMLNFLVALTAVLGGLVGFFLSSQVESLTAFLIPLAAGGFIYLAASDLLPEVKKEQGTKQSIIYFFTFIGGIALMYVLLFIEQFDPPVTKASLAVAKDGIGVYIKHGDPITLVL